MVSRRTVLLGLAASSLAPVLAACGGAAAPDSLPTVGARASEAPTSPAAGPGSAVSTGSAGTPAAATRPPRFATPTTTTTRAVALYGVSGPFSGTNAAYGRIWKRAMAMALDEINRNGGIKGHRVDLVYEDTQSDPKQAVPVAQMFVDDPRVLAELGDFASPASMAASPTYERAKMVQFAFTDSHPDFTGGGEFMFSIVLTPGQEAAFLAEAAFRNLGKVQAVLYRNTDRGKVAQQVYVDTIKELGGKVVAVESYLETEKDFKSILSKVRDARPEVLALISDDAAGALILQQARAMGIEAKVVANGACYSPQFLKLGGDAVNGVLLTTGFFPDDPRTEVRQFVRSYQDRYHETPDQFAALAYDAVKIITWATDKGGFDRVAIQRAMATGTAIPSVIYGPFKFGPDRRVENARAVPIQVKDGKFVLFQG